MNVERLINSAPASELRDDPAILALRDRVSQLEEENASLQQADAALRRNIRLFEALWSRSLDGVFLVTPQLTILRMIHSIFGHDDQNCSGSSLLVLVHPEDHSRVTDTFARLLSDPSHSLLCEYRVSDRQGHWFWVESEMTDMLDDPDIQAIVFNSRNITERRKYEEAIEGAASPCRECEHARRKGERGCS